jgi:beta-1,2-mannobiose phosphorylase / 1,2-beta-oligomannan phosphorylase
MATYKRYKNNPILSPKSNAYWERIASFNGCPIKKNGKLHLLYRAMSDIKYNNGAMMNVSSVGHAIADKNNEFRNRTQLIKPEEGWELFGCEDPRVTELDGKYYIFYTALSHYPFTAEGIKIGVAVTKDFKKIEKHQVTTFNSKAMAMFPKKINGKIHVILTANTEKLPADIAIASFKDEKEMWSKRFWNKWYENIDEHKIDFGQRDEDHIEIGAPPLETEKGWLLVYSYIKNYFTPNEVVFQIKTILLDKKNPRKVIGKSETLMRPEESYEIYGQVPNIVFPSGAYIEDDDLHIYYGATDTTCCAAKFKLKPLLRDMTLKEGEKFSLKRSPKNPIISPTENEWEAKATFNAAAIYLGDKFHIIYRAMAHRGNCVFGYASSKDGLKIDERLDKPIYVPRMPFEIKEGDGWSGCEDPRLVLFEDKIYMFYTAFDGVNPPSVALSSIEIDDFLNKNWKWELPRIISPLTEFNKNACIFPERIDGKIIALHRMNNSIDFQRIDDLNFEKGELGNETNWIIPRKGMWDSRKIGITGPPIKTDAGWLLIYHGVSRHATYRLGAILLDKDDPEKIISRADGPILEPIMDYEKEGQVPNVVFSCGVVLKDDTLFVYYGGGDTVIGVATAKLEEVLEKLRECVYD